MPPIAKEKEVLTATADTVSRPTANAASDASFKAQPVALEVAVTVNGARTLEGSDKREPFSESTKTVLVFGNGAVIRLSSSVAPGQLLFLTNDNTKKEVVCQVVKSKNYRSVSGYVELEFTEAVVGFWGMRFPGDRLASASAPAVPAPQTFGLPAAGGAPPVPRTAAPKVETLAPTAAPKRVEEHAAAKPLAPVAQITPAKSTTLDPEAASSAAPAKPAPLIGHAFDAPRASDAQASIFAPPPTSAVPSAIEALTFSSVSGAKSAASFVAHPPQAPIAANTDSETLKQHTARLKEQLSDLLFTDASPAQAVAKAPAARTTEPAAPANAATKILQNAKIEPAPLPVKLASLPAKSSLDAAQLQIPAWLEPLARNAAAPASTQELIDREKAKRLAEQDKVEKAEELEVVEDISAETVSPVEEEQVSESEALTFDDTLSSEENLSTDENDSESPGKGRRFAAIAAGVLLLAGGAWWYMRPPSRGVVASPPAAAKSQTQTSASGASVHTESLLPQSGAVLPISSPVPTSPADRLDPGSQSKPAPNGVGPAPANGPAATARNDKAAAGSGGGGLSPVTIASTQPAAKQPKKPALGQIRLATPTVKKRGGTQDNGEADAALILNSDKPESNADGLGTGLAGNSTGLATPAAPVPVGGDVRPAKLITSVAPIYSGLAKSQHVSGNVLIDALIDANGHVIAMKVVSGPTLLHQSAMEALRQWKYQPALLDGKPVPMHLTVTIQFRIQ